MIVAGPVDRFEPGTVTAFPEGRFYLARLAGGGFLALLLDVRVDLHGRTVLGRAVAASLSFGVGAVGHQHLLHEVGVRQHLLDQRRLRLALPRKLREAFRRSLEQDNVFHEFRIQRSNVTNPVILCTSLF